MFIPSLDCTLFGERLLHYHLGAEPAAAEAASERKRPVYGVVKRPAAALSEPSQIRSCPFLCPTVEFLVSLH